MIFQRNEERGVRYGTILGLRNLRNPIEEPLGALANAVNFDHTDDNGIERRDGYSLSAALSTATDLYSPVKAEGLYAVADGSLVSYSDALAPTTVATGLTDTTLNWAEMDNRVAYAGAVDAGIIYNRTEFVPLRVPTPATLTTTTVAGTLPAATYLVSVTYRHGTTGVAGGATNTTHTLAAPGGIEMSVPAQSGYVADFYVSDPNGDTPHLVGDSATTFELSALGYYGASIDPEQRDGLELPSGIVALAEFQNRLYAATYDANTDVSTVMWSGAYYPHVWAVYRDWFAVRGQVLAMWGTPTALLIGTTDRIFVHEGETLKMLAAFGVVPGRPFHADKTGRVAIWTRRGVCTYPEFKAAQMEKVAVAPGAHCSVAAVSRRGRKQFLVSTDGNGEAWNTWS
jgi:hypothetical protein